MNLKVHVIEKLKKNTMIKRKHLSLICTSMDMESSDYDNTQSVKTGASKRFHDGRLWKLRPINLKKTSPDNSNDPTTLPT